MKKNSEKQIVFSLTDGIIRMSVRAYTSKEEEEV